MRTYRRRIQSTSTHIRNVRVLRQINKQTEILKNIKEKNFDYFQNKIYKLLRISSQDQIEDLILSKKLTLTVLVERKKFI